MCTCTVLHLHVLPGDDRSVDHVVFVVPGMGPFADARFNSFKSPVDSGE